MRTSRTPSKRQALDRLGIILDLRIENIDLHFTPGGRRYSVTIDGTEIGVGCWRNLHRLSSLSGVLAEHGLRINRGTDSFGREVVAAWWSETLCSYMRAYLEEVRR